MGINGLNHFINERSNNTFKVVPITETGKSVAIDTTNWLYIPAYEANIRVIDETDVVSEELSRISYMRIFKELVIIFIKMWLENGITPYFIFDGNAPVDKQNTRSKRREKTQLIKDNINTLKEEFKGKDRLMISPAKITQMKTYMKQDLYISTDETRQIKDLIFSFGIPVLQCTEEGEKLCSALAINGIVDAVFSTDTDNLTYGVPLLINKFVGNERDKHGNWVPSVRIIKCEDVLKALDLTYKEFVDFCIGCGCDYNDHMSKVGPATIYKLIKQYRSIENFPSKYNVSCLRVERCRELFTITGYEDILKHGNIEPICENYIKYGKPILQRFGCESYIFVFNKFYQIE